MEMHKSHLDSAKQTKSEGGHSSVDGALSFHLASGTSESAGQHDNNYDEPKEYSPMEILDWETDVYGG